LRPPARLAFRPEPEEPVRMTRSLGFVARSRNALSRGTRVALLAALTLGIALGGSGCGKGQGKTLVTTGSRRLTVEEFEEYARDPQVMQPYGMLPDTAQKRALFNDLLSYEVLAEAGARAGFAKDSAYTNIERDALPRILPDALYDKHIGSTVKVSEAEAKLFYDSQTTEHRIGVIMVADDKIAGVALQRLEAGDKFSDVAKATSLDPSAKTTGGEVQGWITFGQLPPDVEKAVAPLKDGQHTGIIPQRTGTYIFALLESRPRATPPPFESNKAEVIKMLENRKKGALVDQYLTGLKAKYGLKIDGPGWTAVTEKMLVLPDSLARWLGTDPKRAGMTDAELKQTIATWTGRDYTVHDLLNDMQASPMNERPPSNNVALVKMFIEGKAMNDILVTEAKKEGLTDAPKVRRQIDRARSAYLVNKYVEKTLPSGSIGFPSPTQLDSLTRTMIAANGQAAPANITFQMLPQQVQQQIVGEWQTRRRQAMLKAEVDRLKAELKPNIDDKALQAIPWPVPAEADKEKA
jgi:peptidyl-prolyl cis-trans isomerase C